MEGSSSEDILESLMPDNVSPEDIAWADSCLINDPEYLDINLDSIKDALLDMLDNNGESEMDAVLSNHNSETEELLINGQLTKTENVDQITKDAEISTTPHLGHIFNEKADDLSSLQDTITANHEEGEASTNMIIGETDTLPYDELDGNTREATLQEAIREQLINEGASSSCHDTNFTTIKEVEPSTKDDIFKVWDLEISVEEAEEIDVLNRLKKFVADTSTSSAQLISDDSIALKDVSLHDLIAAVSDMSLNKL